MSLPTSVQIIASIDDLLTQILLRLPIRSLVRFTAVSTHWYDLITDPKFCRLRNPNPKSNSASGIFFNLNNERSPLYAYIPFPVQNPSNPHFEWLQSVDAKYGCIIIIQSCNGLLLCRRRRFFPSFRYYVYNPTINRFASLPKPPDQEVVTKKPGRMNLAFDLSKSPHYKVVCVEQGQLLNEGMFTYYLQVYSSETDLWKVSTKRSFKHKQHFDDGVYWNGSLHWIGGYLYDYVISFVIDDDRLEMLPLPEGLGKRVRCLCESYDHLHLIAEWRRLQFNVYEMKKDDSEWFVKYRVDLLPLCPVHVRSPYGMMSVFCVIRGEKDEDDFLVFQSVGNPIRYNLVSMTFQELHHPWLPTHELDDSLKLIFPGMNGFQYIESLYWV